MIRIPSIDITRGLVMVIMALDHVRDFVHQTALTQDPLNLAITTPLLFLTRWVTHLCAPTFVFLAGISAFLYLNNVGKLESRNFLLTRGLWLILLDFTVVNLALFFDIHFRTMMFEVIAATGFGFLVLGVLIHVSPKIHGVIGLLIVCGQGLIPLIPFEEGSTLKAVLTSLFSQTAIPLGAERLFVMAYPPIPWLGILLLGFSAGSFLIGIDAGKRKSTFMRMGIACMAFFVGLRMLNVYGDIPWSSQKDTMFTILSFINVTKYPPTLLFTLLMLGFMFLILALAENRQNQSTGILQVYGRVPLFYFVIHLFLAHLIMLGIMFAQGFSWEQLNFGPFGFGRPKELSGLGLAGTYLVWMAVVALMYPMCRGFGAYKEMNRKRIWLRYF